MTHRLSLDVQLDAAILDFAPKYMKNQLEHLARECDQRLERELLPQFHAILAQVHQERDAFEKQKQDVIRDLRAHLDLLRFDAATVEQAINQLHVIVPSHFAFFPSMSSLTLPMTASSFTPASASTSRSTPSTATSSNSTFGDLPNAVLGSHAASSIESAPAVDALDSTTQSNLTMPSDLDYAAQCFATAESSTTTCSPKRDRSAESDAPCKRQRTAKEKVCATIDLVMSVMHLTSIVDIFETSRSRRPAHGCVPKFEDRRYDHGLFHSQHQVLVPDNVYFVMRIEKDILSFDNNRALKHFQEHAKNAAREEKLTNESIFERYAWQVWGGEMASKYWIREHVGAKPHTFLPTTPLPGNPLGDRMSSMRRHDKVDDFSPPFPRLRESIHSHQSTNEGECEKPRRTLRNVPRLDYAEIVAPWNNDVESYQRGETDMSVRHLRQLRLLGLPHLTIWLYVRTLAEAISSTLKPQFESRNKP
ncbi:hypothetical protein RRF57_009067 [Xylaria bambusicola]|uniref:Uncharacterized protein n=1 Tax=Xylaria bambusicola TaxID=326684 RepID=A0AAN7ZBR6_9PEZI